jgi:hypothetical protein
MLGGGDGCYGSAVSKAMNVVGTLARGEVGPYSGQRAKQWGRQGAPADMKAKAAAFKTGPWANVGDNDQAIAVLNSGHPFTICTARGFAMTRDSEGFCRMQGRWGHCMFVSAYRTDRPGFLIHQSWGRKTPSGPTALGQPDWSFWCEPDAMASILAEGDSWAPSTSRGFAAQSLPDELRRAS